MLRVPDFLLLLLRLGSLGYWWLVRGKGFFQLVGEVCNEDFYGGKMPVFI